MATSAFRSTTKRTSIGGKQTVEESASSNRTHRRSRSLSQFSRRPPELDHDFSGDEIVPKSRFVNTTRGSGFPDISLDDLAIEFSAHRDEADEQMSNRGRLNRRFSEMGTPASVNLSQQRRGRSVSRQRNGDGKSNIVSGGGGGGGGRMASDASSRRRRSVSVVRYPISDSESDKDLSNKHENLKKFNKGTAQMPLLHKPKTPNQRFLGRSMSQKDLSKFHDDYSSQSSALTDDETKDAYSRKKVVEKTIRAVYAQKKVDNPVGDDGSCGLYDTMRKELRNAVDEIKTELEQAMVRKSSVSGRSMQSKETGVLQAVSSIRKNYSAKLEQSEKRKQDLLAEILLEEQRGLELSEIVNELHTNPKNSTLQEKTRPRKRTGDRNAMSEELIDDAEKYIEEFLSNVEDTDISSLDGERSDTSSAIDVSMRGRDARFHYGERETFLSPTSANSASVEMDGVILPWLQWETSNDSSFQKSTNKRELPIAPINMAWDTALEAATMRHDDHQSHSTSSLGNWSPVINTHYLIDEKPGSITKNSTFDMDKYLRLKKEEDVLVERWRERSRIVSGGLLLCSNGFF
ncbi:uncharacterized protein LOC124920421 [Impatiens glandulifera]|uniref:uncharacterized protein LOC124920421 n=1 Tax=Impatiens glandulifera TaxID=253017 RepID=UPI001FB069B6|nr:uncharacterized protein LOC124920421 [Impatiens glandulifera]